MELKPKIRNDEYSYFETTFSGYGASGIMCLAPHYYQRNSHKNLFSILKDYSCTADKLPFDEFPGWDDPLAYSPLCRDWFTDSVERPNQDYFTEAYEYANEPVIAISLCAPFFRGD